MKARNGVELGQQAIDYHSLAVLLQVQRLAERYHLDHRFVGGTISDLLAPETTFDIDPTNNVIRLEQYRDPCLIRPSDRTVSDIDLVVFTPFSANVLSFREELKQYRHQQRLPFDFPHVGIGRTRYPESGRRFSPLQLTSGIDADNEGNIHFVLGSVRVPIDGRSVAPWEYRFGDNVVTGFGPLQHYYRYKM